MTYVFKFNIIIICMFFKINKDCDVGSVESIVALTNTEVICLDLH